jgi:hypothetical protein
MYLSYSKHCFSSSTISALRLQTWTQEALSSLLNFERRLSEVGENSVNIVRQLIDHYHREKESIVRWKIAHVLGVFAKHPQCASDSVVEEMW